MSTGELALLASLRADYGREVSKSQSEGVEQAKEDLKLALPLRLPDPSKERKGGQ